MFDVDDLVFSPPELGCVLYLPGPSGGGSKTQDRSAYANHGSITGATWARLPGGLWYLRFDGTDDYADCGNGDSLKNITLAISVLAWVNTDTRNRSILGKYDPSGGNRAWVLRGGTFAVMENKGAFDANTVALPTTDIGDSEWHFLAGVWSTGKKPEIFVDGVSDGVANSAVTDMDVVAPNVLVGDSAYSATENWKGPIALPRIYNRALNALEISNHFNREKHLFGAW